MERVERSSLDLDNAIRQAAETIRNANILVYMTGAGMSVDAGLGTYRGERALDLEDVWPPAKQHSVGFYQLAKPRTLLEQPVLVWSYYKKRWDAYSNAKPHHGYHTLANWATRFAPGGVFSFTSNVDGLWSYYNTDTDRYLFPDAPNRVLECHGSMWYMQCTQKCEGSGVWRADRECEALQLDPQTQMLKGGENADLPKCPVCGSMARLNVFGIGDRHFHNKRRAAQKKSYNQFKRLAGNARVVVVEVGAGISIPTVRCESAWWVRNKNATLIRINPEYPYIEDTNIKDAHIEPDPRHVSIYGLGAASALGAINAHLQ